MKCVPPLRTQTLKKNRVSFPSHQFWLTNFSYKTSSVSSSHSRMYHTGAGVNDWVPRIDPAYLKYGLKPRHQKSHQRLPPTWLQTMFLRILLRAQRIKLRLNILLIRIRLTVLRVRLHLTVLCIRSLLAVWRIMVFLTVLCVRAHRQVSDCSDMNIHEVQLSRSCIKPASTTHVGMAML